MKDLQQNIHKTGARNTHVKTQHWQFQLHQTHLEQGVTMPQIRNNGSEENLGKRPTIRHIKATTFTNTTKSITSWMNTTSKKSTPRWPHCWNTKKDTKKQPEHTITVAWIQRPLSTHNAIWVKKQHARAQKTQEEWGKIYLKCTPWMNTKYVHSWSAHWISKSGISALLKSGKNPLSEDVWIHFT
jgi:hypothetical protein